MTIKYIPYGTKLLVKENIDKIDEVLVIHPIFPYQM